MLLPSPFYNFWHRKDEETTGVPCELHMVCVLLQKSSSSGVCLFFYAIVQQYTLTALYVPKLPPFFPLYDVTLTLGTLTATTVHMGNGWQIILLNQKFNWFLLSHENKNRKLLPCSYNTPMKYLVLSNFIKEELSMLVAKLLRCEAT